MPSSTPPTPYPKCRIGRIFCVNNGFTIQTLWKIVKTFLDPVTASKIVFCGTNLDILNEQFTKDHPYVQYLHTRQNTKGSKARDLVPLPKVSPHEPTWQIAVAEDAAGLEGPAKAVAVPVEAVRVSDQDFQQRLSSGSMSSSRDERESWTSQHDMIKSFDQVRSSPSASAKSFDRSKTALHHPTNPKVHLTNPKGCRPNSNKSRLLKHPGPSELLARAFGKSSTIQKSKIMAAGLSTWALVRWLKYADDEQS